VTKCCLSESTTPTEQTKQPERQTSILHLKHELLVVVVIMIIPIVIIMVLVITLLGNGASMPTNFTSVT
jgi:hypothetical protein